MRRVRFTIARLMGATAIVAVAMVVTPFSGDNVELTVCIGIFSGAFLGVMAGGLKGLLIGMVMGFVLPSIALFLPAVQAARSGVGSPPRYRNLRAIGLAMHYYHDEHDSLPPSIIRSEDGTAMHSWRVLIAPYLQKQFEGSAGWYRSKRFNSGFRDGYRFWRKEQIALQKALQLKQFLAQYDLAEPWNGPHNKTLVEKHPDVFSIPDIESGTGFTNYVVVISSETAWQEDGPVRLQDFADGISQTILVVELENSDIRWTEPRDVTWEAITSPSRGLPKLFGDPPKPGVCVLFGDGHVIYLSNTTTQAQLKALLTRSGND